MTDKSFIANIVKESPYEEELKSIFSDHFDNLEQPVSLSLGIHLNGLHVNDIVSLLRANGIDAVPYYDPKVKENLNCFVVDGTGVRSPFLTPEDAVKATADIFNTLRKENIDTSRALPVTKRNLIPAISRVYDQKTINISDNNPNEKDVDSFLSQQLEAAKSMPAVDVLQTRKEHVLYRGGTLGDNPYALTFHRRQRDAAYATKSFSDAATYADGVRGAGLKYKEINGIHYGFIYEYKESIGQAFYGMAEIEQPKGSKECVGHSENKKDYETLIRPDRNQVTSVYLKAGDRVVKIADDKGFYSPEWEHFAKLHTPYNISEKNDYMQERMNKQIADFRVVPYIKENAPLKDEYKSFTPDIHGLVFSSAIKNGKENGTDIIEINNADFSSIIPPEKSDMYYTGDFSMDNCSASGIINLSKCTGIVGISNSTLSSTDNLVFPQECRCFFFSNVNIPEGNTLDLSNLKTNIVSLENQNCAKLGAFYPPKEAMIKFKKGTSLPKNMDWECKEVILSSFQPPEGQKIDLSQVKSNNFTFEDQNFSNMDTISLPENPNVTICGGNTKLPEKLPLKCDTLSFVDIKSQQETFLRLSNLDMSKAECPFFSFSFRNQKCEEFILNNVTFPAGSILDLSKTKCKSFVFEDQDFSKLGKLILPENAAVQIKGNTILPPKKTKNKSLQSKISDYKLTTEEKEVKSKGLHSKILTAGTNKTAEKSSRTPSTPSSENLKALKQQRDIHAY